MDSTIRPLESGLRIKLSVMMFLQYAIWGAWLPFLYSFLSGYRNMPGDQIGEMFAAGAVGAVSTAVAYCSSCRYGCCS